LETIATDILTKTVNENQINKKKKDATIIPSKGNINYYITRKLPHDDELQVQERLIFKAEANYRVFQSKVERLATMSF
jgi:predicted transcriptional regulator